MATRIRTWLSVILCFAFILNGLPASASFMRASDRSAGLVQGFSDPSPQKNAEMHGNEAATHPAASLVVPNAPVVDGYTALIEITTSGFEPAVTTVEAGTAVTWKNETSQTQVLKSGEPYVIYLPLILRQAPGAAAVLPSARLAMAIPLRTAADDFMATIAPGGTFTHTFITEGDHPYYLATDFKLRGRVTVIESVPPDPVDVAPPIRVITE